MKSKKYRFQLTLTPYQKEQLEALVEVEQTTPTVVLETALARMYHDKIGVIESNEKRSK